jgi:hypothetical protein
MSDSGDGWPDRPKEALKLPPALSSTQAMMRRILQVLPAIALSAMPLCAAAQEISPPPAPDMELPGISSYANPQHDGPLATAQAGNVTLTAQLEDDSGEIPSGLVWRIYAPEPGEDGKLPLLSTASGGTSTFQLEPGSYLVHAAFGRAGATKRITVGREPHREVFVLDAGGLKLEATMPDGQRVPRGELKFSIYESEPDASGQRPLIVPDVEAGSVVRLNSGVYHIVSNYGSVNAVVRSDIRVEAGKLTEATMEQRGAELTMKLVREEGGEAIADTSWSILAENGDIVREVVGAYATMVLAEGNYTAIARNRERLYEKNFTVVPGRNQEVEVLTSAQVPEIEVPQD